MPAIPNALERAALSLGLVPPFLVDVVSAGSLRALGIAMRLGILDRLPATADELAAYAKADRVSVGMLIDLLARTGYLTQKDGRYQLSRAASRWLGPRGTPHFAEYWDRIVFSYFDALEAAVRSGSPQPHLHEWLRRSGTWPTFNAAMGELAASTADAVARAAALPKEIRTLADVGGSHGLNAAAFCRIHPHLRATVIDVPEARPARADERITFRAADITRDDLGGPYDAALLFQLIHYFAPDANRALLRQVHDALAPGGAVVIFDQLRGAAPTPLAKAFFSLLALTYRTGLGGDVYGYDEIVDWLRDAGFREIRKRSVRGAPGNALIIAR